MIFTRFTVYRSHFELMPKYNVGLKTRLQKGLLYPDVFGDLVCKFRIIVEF